MSEANTQTQIDPNAAAPAATTPPAAGAPGGTQAAPPAAGEKQWYSDFKDEGVRNYIATKGLQNAEQLAMSYQNMEKLKGVPENELMRIPTDPASPEWQKVYERLGTPKDKSGYKIEGVKGDAASEQFTEWAKDTFLDAKLTGEQASKVVQKFDNYMKDAQAKQLADNQAQVKAQLDALKTEWGSTYDQNLNIAKTGARTFNVDEGTIDKISAVLGVKETFKLFQNIGSKLGEAGFVQGQAKGIGRDLPDVAKAHIAAMKADKEFGAKLESGDAQAKAKWNKAHNDAFGA